MDAIDVARWAIYFAVLTWSCVIHECAHVWVALKLGDPTGKMEGRLTLNPVPHFDFFWTFLLPLITWLRGGMPIGGPKPAPVNPLNFNDPRSGSMWSGLAGPATNAALAGSAFLTLLVLQRLLPSWVEGRSYNALFLTSVMFINVGLTAFNLIPIPPLDGSRFLRYLLGPGSDNILDGIERLGAIPICVVAWLFAPYAVGPAGAALYFLLARVFGPEYSHDLVNTYFGR